jgi:putative tricarboxylic transport membrane protein
LRNDDHPDSANGDERGSAGKSPIIHLTDLWLALLILTGCAALYYATTRFEEISPLMAQNIPPEFFPRMLIWTIVALTLFLPIEHRFLEKGRKGLDKDRSVRISPMTFMTAGLLCAVVASALVVGTLISMVMVCVLLPLLWGERRPKVLISFAILFPGAVTLLFSQVLKVYFEPGVFGVVLH